MDYRSPVKEEGCFSEPDGAKIQDIDQVFPFVNKV